MKAEQLELYLVTDRDLSLGRDLEWIVAEAVKGGVTMVQLREKTASTGEFVELARRLKILLEGSNVPLIVNDRVDVALAVGADGVHIGQSDMSYEDARRLLGPDKIVGLSVENLDEVRQANLLDVDYIGVSPVYPTSTKTDTAQAFGLGGLEAAVGLSVHPVVAIGGMNRETAADVIESGADGIAVVSAIVSAAEPAIAAKELLDIVKAANTGKWTREVWKSSLKIYKEILKEPFIKELADGDLCIDKFARYIAQDKVYLGNYGRQMSELAEMMDDPRQRAFFTAFAKGGMESEKAMHELLISRFGIDTAVEASIVTRWYNNHTQKAVDSGSKEIALAGLLPCAWIYNKVGLHILRTATLDNNPYKEWILEYGNEEFTVGVNALLELADEWAENAAPEVRTQMTSAYLKSAFGELAFWDYGYRGESGDYSYLNDLEKWL